MQLFEDQEPDEQVPPHQQHLPDSHSTDLSGSSLSSGPATLNYPRIAGALEVLYLHRTPWILDQAGNPDDIEIKPDGSSVTNVDKDLEDQLANLFQRMLPQALFIGEETWEPLQNDPALAESYYHIVVSDPIDGTSNFIQGSLNGFASVLGVWKVSKAGYEPEFGSVLCPDEGCLYYTLDDEAYRFDFFTGKTETYKVDPLPLTDRVIFTSLPGARGVTTQDSTQHLADHRQGKEFVLDIVGLIQGEGHAAVCQGKLWDVAGPFAIAKALGFSMYSLKTGQELQALQVVGSSSADNPWDVSEPFLVCRPEHVKKALDCIA